MSEYYGFYLDDNDPEDNVLYVQASPAKKQEFLDTLKEVRQNTTNIIIPRDNPGILLVTILLNQGLDRLTRIVSHTYLSEYIITFEVSVEIDNEHLDAWIGSITILDGIDELFPRGLNVLVFQKCIMLDFPTATELSQFAEFLTSYAGELLISQK